jgi:hypothetical protein
VIETIGAGEGIRTLDPNLGKVAVGAFYSPSVAVLPLGFAARSTGRRPISPAVDAPIGSEKDRPERSRSCSFDQRRRPETLRTAMAMAFFCPTRTTSRLPRVQWDGVFVQDHADAASKSGGPLAAVMAPAAKTPARGP